MAPTILSPNPDNYQIGKGVLSFKKTGALTYRDLGNAPAVSISIDRTKLDHFSSRAGIRTKDKSITIENTCTVNITLDEITPDNLALLLLGDVDDAAVGGPTVDIFQNAEITGALRFVGANSVGAQITADWYNVSFGPAGDLNLISDEWNQIELEAEALADTTAGPTLGKIGLLKFTNVTPAS